MRAAATRGGDDGAGRRDEANDDEEERRDEADEGEGNGRGDDAETLEYFMGDAARGALTELDLGKYARLTTLRVVKCGDVVSLIGLGGVRESAERDGGGVRPEVFGRRERVSRVGGVVRVRERD